MTRPLALVADPDPDCRDTFAALLRELGYDVCLADSCEAAKRRLETDAINLLVLERTLPGCDALDLALSDAAAGARVLLLDTQLPSTPPVASPTARVATVSKLLDVNQILLLVKGMLPGAQDA